MGKNYYNLKEKVGQKKNLKGPLSKEREKKVKLERAQRECLGIRSRRRTR